jgi:ATP-binding cassette subfamily F protein 3
MLTLSGITVRLGGRVILDGATAALPRRARIGLVGRNGAGKTTLFGVISGRIEPDAGTVKTPRGTRVGTVAQEAPGGTATPFETVLAADTERTELLRETELGGADHRLGEIHERLNTIDAHGAPARVARILSGLGFSEEEQKKRPIESFSGGWRMRVALASVLFMEPDVLLLDEPSNHLDLESELWLESYLKTYRGTLLLISHERDFLNQVSDHILHLHEGTLTLTPGGYDAFERLRRERKVHVTAARTRQLAQRQRLQEFVDRWRTKAHSARQAQSRLKALARMKPIDAMGEDPSLAFDFPQPDKQRPPLMVLENAAAGYVPDRPVLSRLNLRFDPDDRVALLGRNGNGKTTLARLLAGQLRPMAGAIRAGRKVRVGYFAQLQIEELAEDESAFQHMSRMLPDADPLSVRNQLGRFGFSGDMVDVDAGNLSGGERARLALALITRESPHLLILDEPTNHLDIDAREALVQTLNGYQGAVIIVSHDRHLLDLTADRLVLVADGTAAEFDGTLDDYRDVVLSRPERKAAGGRKTINSRKTERRAGARRRESTASLRQEMKEAEESMAKLDQRRSELDRVISNPEAARNGTVSEIMKQRAAVVRELSAAEDLWLQAYEALGRFGGDT